MPALLLDNVEILVELSVQFSLVHLVINKLSHSTLVEVDSTFRVIAANANVRERHLKHKIRTNASTKFAQKS